jgi:hypothetical protein
MNMNTKKVILPAPDSRGAIINNNIPIHPTEKKEVYYKAPTSTKDNNQKILYNHL